MVLFFFMQMMISDMRHELCCRGGSRSVGQNKSRGPGTSFLRREERVCPKSFPRFGAARCLGSASLPRSSATTIPPPLCCLFEHRRLLSITSPADNRTEIEIPPYKTPSSYSPCWCRRPVDLCGVSSSICLDPSRLDRSPRSPCPPVALRRTRIS